MALPAEMTLLVMTSIGVPLYAARGLSQTLTPVADAKPTPKRTINGEARFLGASQMRKYDSVISCTDVDAPPFGSVWPGDQLVIDCVCELAYKTVGGSAERTVVASRTIGNFTYYRPRITFLVVDFEQDFEEYGCQYQWRLTLTEK